MNAIPKLQPITILPLQRPAYRRSDLLGQYRDDWIAQNLDLLERWYDQLSECSCENEPQVDFREFCLAQHDMQEMQRDQDRDDAREAVNTGWE